MKLHIKWEKERDRVELKHGLKNGNKIKKDGKE